MSALIVAGISAFMLSADPVAAANIVVTSTIQSAINTAKAGDTIVVPAGVYTESLTLNKGISLTGSMSNTTVLYSLPNTKILTVTGTPANAVVTISDLTFANGSGGLGSSLCPKFCGGAIYITGTNKLLIQNVIFRGNSAEEGGAVFADFGSAASLANVQFLNNTAGNRGGAVYVKEPVSATDAQFIGNTALNSQGGALYSELTATLSNTQFINNVATGKGGAAYILGGMLIQNSVVQGNRTTGNNPGGGFLIKLGMVALKTDFISNTSVLAGGAASIGGDVTYSAGTVMSNTASRDAGGLDIGGNATINGVIFVSNTAMHKSLAATGGAIRVAGNVTLNNAQFINNTAKTSGGAASVAGTATIADSRFESNQSTSGTGGALNVPNLLTLNNSVFLSNTASGNGGAILAGSDSMIVSSIFAGNRSLVAGGGAFYNNILSNTIVISSEFSGNSATSDGGAIRVTGAISVTGGRVLNNRCSDNSCKGGGIYVNNSRLDMAGTQVNANLASKGGGIWINSGAASVSNAHFESNSATEVGALYVSQNLVMNNTDVMSNTATGGNTWGGGGVLAQGGATVFGGLFLNNIERGNNHRGGALYVASGVLSVNSARFLGNDAALGGAIYQAGLSDAFITNTLLARNTATTGNGMAIYFGADAQASVVHTTIASPTLAAGSAIFVAAGSFTSTNTILVNHVVGIQNSTNGPIQEDYNLVYGNTTHFQGTITSYGNTLIANPYFANMNVDDYHLTPASIAIERGITVTGVLVDFEGDSRIREQMPDIGFDESPYPIVVDLGLNKAWSSVTLLPGQPVTYNINFGNFGPQPHGPKPHGPLPIPDLFITDVVPSELMSLTLSTSGMPLSRTNNVTFAWTISNMWPGQAGQIMVSGVVSPLISIPTPLKGTTVISSIFDSQALINNTVADAVMVQPPQADIADARIQESDTGKRMMVFTVTLSPANPYAGATLNYATQDGSASAGSDYDSTTGSIYFAPGESSKFISVAINGDYLVEADETVVVRLSNSVAAVIGRASATGVIQNNDIAVSGLQIQTSAPTLIGHDTYFSASAPAGDNITYVWDFGDGSPTVTGAFVSHTYPAVVANYIATLTATNPSGSAVMSTSVEMVDFPISSVLLTGVPTTTTGITQTFAVSVDIGSNVICNWMVNDAPVGTGPNLPYVFEDPGTYVVKVIVSNAVSRITRSMTVLVQQSDMRVYLPALGRPN